MLYMGRVNSKSRKILINAPKMLGLRGKLLRASLHLTKVESYGVSSILEEVKRGKRDSYREQFTPKNYRGRSGVVFVNKIRGLEKLDKIEKGG